MKSKYAPIIITVYDRIDHFKQCVESLLRNPESSETELFISSDGPTNAASSERVELVRDYSKVIKGFKKVTAFSPKENTNSQIMRDVIERVKCDYDSYIITEDDNIFSKSALKFLNDGLDTYANSKKVFAVSAFLYPDFPRNDNDQIFLPCFAGYGTGYWSDKDIFGSKAHEQKLSRDALRNLKTFSRVNRVAPHLAPMMYKIALGKLVAGDVAYTLHCLLEDKVCVFPPISLVRNTGHDGSGVHCGVNPRFSEQLILESEVMLNPYKRVAVKRDHQIWLFNFFGGRLSAIRGMEIFFSFNLRPMWLQKLYLTSTNLIKMLIKAVRSKMA